jgi:membrane-associated protease RseP (regulator of RpoE activity)
MSFQEGTSGREIVVADVAPGAPAREAGLRRGDRIIRWNNRTDVANAIRSVPVAPGEVVRLTVAARNGQAERELSITAVERPADVASRPTAPMGDPPRGFSRPRDDNGPPRPDRDRLDLQVDSLNSRLRGFFRDSLRNFTPGGRPDAPPRPQGPGEPPRAFRENGGLLGLMLANGRRAVAGAELADVTAGLGNYFGTSTGALVVRVAPESPAARAGLRDGDVILSVNGEAITNVAELRWHLSQPGVREFRLDLLRDKTRRTVTLGENGA